MASFDVVSKVDTQTLDNVINVVKKEIVNRYDFRDSKTNVELDKKEMIVKILTETDLRLEAIEDVLRSRMIKQNLSPLSLDFGKSHYASGNMIRKDIKIKQGIDKESGKKIVKHIKDLKLKVEAQIMDDQVRVTGKKIDDLQMIMNVLRQLELELPLQFINFK